MTDVHYIILVISLIPVWWWLMGKLGGPEI